MQRILLAANGLKRNRPFALRCFSSIIDKKNDLKHQIEKAVDEEAKFFLPNQLIE